MTDKELNLFDECTARCVHMFPLYTSSSIANSQKMQTKINESSTIAKIRI